MTHIFFITQDGEVRFEKAPVNGRYIEMRDGYHPLTNDSYWQDEKRESQAQLVIFENVLGPLGSEMAEQDVKALLTEAVIITRMHKKMQVNKAWMRLLARFFEWIRRYGIWLFVISFAGYFVAQAMFPSLFGVS